jgi:hypothetical protein
MLSNIRVGRFTSSSIHFLMKKGRGGAPSVATQSYIEEKIMERKLGRTLNADLSSRPTVWGHALEKRLNTLLNMFEYNYCSDETIQHPTIPSWVGTPDFITSDRVVDAKCPYTLKAFCQLADIAIAGDVLKLKEDKPEYYWQLVSNSILTKKVNAELIVYCPYKSELQDIRDTTEALEEGDQNKLAWIYFSDDEDLPYLVEGNYYKNLYKFVFEVPEIDKDALTSSVVEASKLLEV